MEEIRFETLALSVLVVFAVSSARSATLTRGPRVAREAEYPVNYLTEYGYLSRKNLETGELRSHDEIIMAVKNLQKMAGLPPTGHLDDPALESMKIKARCGVEDGRVGKILNAPSSFKIGEPKWDKTIITFKIIKYTQDYDREYQRRDFHRAFEIWKNVTDLEFVEVHKNVEADIVISFERYDHRDGYPFDGEGRTLAHAFPPGPERGGDAHFDEDETWGEGGKEGTIDLFMVAAHEFGHSLGIQHSDNKEALMYPWYSSYTPNFQLSHDDIRAIWTLYGPPKRKYWKPPIIASSLPSTTTRRPPPTKRPGRDKPPNPCNTDIDAVSNVRGEVFAFKGKWFWRFDTDGVLMGDKPIKTSQFWNVLPGSLERVDAVTFIPQKDLIFFFSGQRYWILRGRDLAEGTPSQGYPLNRLGLPAEIKNIDAALTWGLNDRTYLFTGYIYWRLDNTTWDFRVEAGYPKAFDIWQGIPVPIDAAFKGVDGSTYFFRGRQFFKFDDKNMVVDPRYPQDIGKMWLNCKYTLGYISSSTLPVFSGLLYLSTVGSFLATILMASN